MISSVIVIDGILRFAGRMAHANLPYTAKHPTLRDADHGFTNLIIRDSNEKAMHRGVKETLTELRSKFGLVKGTQIVKNVHNCVTYRRHEGMPYHTPRPPPPT